MIFSKKIIFSKSKTLDNYSIFIDKIREYQVENNTLEKAVNLAVKYCIDNNILKEFLMKHSTDVVDFLYGGEYDPEVEMAVVREEAYEESRQYFLELLDQGLTTEEIKERLNRKYL